MEGLTDLESAAWLKSNGIDVLSDDLKPQIVGDCEILFAAPQHARIQGCLARDLAEWIGAFENGLLWVSDWPFYKPDEMALIQTLRRAHGEQRPLIEAPGHLFEWKEREELVGWIYLMISFGWDAYLFTSPFREIMFQTSHEDFVWVASSSVESFATALEVVHKHELPIYRKTKLE